MEKKIVSKYFIKRTKKKMNLEVKRLAQIQRILKIRIK